MRFWQKIVGGCLRSRLTIETLESRQLLAGDGVCSAVAHNSALAEDVNGDGFISPFDALLAINRLNQQSNESEELSGDHALAFLDVNGDGLFSPADAHRVIFVLNPPEHDLRAEAEPGDVEIQIGDTSYFIYNSNDGEIRLETADPIGSISIRSKSGIFEAFESAENLTGVFDIASVNELAKFELADGFGSVSFGNVAPPELTEEFVNNDLMIVGAPPNGSGGGTLSGNDINIDLQLKDLAGNQIDSVEFGEDFLLSVVVEDVHFGPPQDPSAPFGGVFAAYIDVFFDGALVTPVGDFVYGEDYDLVRDGTVSADAFDEVGASASSLFPLGDAPRTLFEIRMRATSGGEVVFTSDSADIFPAHESLLYGLNDAIDPLRINFGTATLDVLDSATQNDLVTFAQGLSQSGTVFYGASWCPQCTLQKELFDDGQDFLNFVEVTNYENEPALSNLNQIGIDNEITVFPTWVFPDGSRLEGFQTLETLSERSGIPIPQSNIPTIIGLDDLSLLSGSPLQVPLNGWDPNHGELTYTVSSDNPELLSAEIIKGGRSLLVDVAGPTTFGKMLFQLHETRAPRVTERIIELAESGFYDGVSFHRIIDEFVIQGGDPTGTGSGGSDLGDFDDQYHPDLQHNQTGVLSMAKTTDDTNDSQFFITEGPSRHLDFNHSIFGQLVEGEGNRDAISNVFDSSQEVRMESVAVVDDTENSLLQLKANEGVTGSATITVTVTDADQHSSTHEFVVSISPDTVNNHPFLEDIPVQPTPVTGPFSFMLPAIDIEGDPIFYYGRPSNGSSFDMSVDENTGEVTVTLGDQEAVFADFWVSATAQPTLNQRRPNDVQQGVEIRFVDEVIANPDFVSVDEDSSTTEFFVLENDIRRENGGPLFISLVQEGDHGTAVVAENRESILYTPDPDYFGQDNVVYAISDGSTSSTTQISIDVQAVNDPPSAFDDFVTVQQGTAQPIDVLVNDSSFPDSGEVLTLTAVTDPPSGATAEIFDNRILYSPPAEFTGDDTFAYVVTDGQASSTAIVTVTVTPEVVVPQLTIDLLPSSDTGIADDDNITNAETLSFEVTNLVVGAFVEIVFSSEGITDGVRFSADATEMVVDVVLPTNGEFTFNAWQLVDGLGGSLSEDLIVSYNRQDVGGVVADPPVELVVGETFNFDFQHPLEGDVVYTAVVNGEPLSIDSESGLLVLPALEPGLFAYAITVTDAAGNTSRSDFTLNVVAGIDDSHIDLVRLAQDLADSGARIFGAHWDAATTDQLQRLGEGAEFLEFIEATNANRELNAAAAANGISTFPTWIFSDETRAEGVLSVEELIDRSGIEQPLTSSPWIPELSDVAIQSESPLHVPLDGFDGTEQGLVYSVAVDGNAVNARILSGNRSLVLNVAGYGPMVFELFENRIPSATASFIEMVESGALAGKEFYQVSSMRIQAGNSDNDAIGTADHGTLHDEFNVEIQHNRRGILALAKLADDGNGADFFVTSTPQREFDFHHTIIGQLVEGESVQAAIESVAMSVGGVPRFPIVIESAEIVDNPEDAIVLISAIDEAGTAEVTVTAENTNGMTSSRTFSVDVTPDTYNSGPFFVDLPDHSVQLGESLTFTLSAVDVENDSLRYFARAMGEIEYGVNFNAISGEVTVTPPEGFTGRLDLLVTVRQFGNQADQVDPFDREVIAIHVVETEPVAVGDLNLDGEVSSDDIDHLCNAIREGSSESRFDVDGNQELNHDDLNHFIAEILGTVVGDSNLDGVFDSSDLVFVFQFAEYEDSVAGNSNWASGDWNCDGEFDSGDLVVAFTAGAFEQDGEA